MAARVREEIPEISWQYARCQNKSKKICSPWLKLNWIFVLLGANQAVAAACLQMAPVAMLCRVGDDIFGKTLLENFQRVGVDYFGENETVIRRGGETESCPSGVASIVVDEKSGDNMIVVSPGANFRLTKDDVRKTIAEAKPSQVLLQLEILPEVASEVSIKRGRLTRTFHA